MIAYVHQDGVYVVNAESGSHKMIADKRGDEFGMSWSPDSRAVLFSIESDARISMYVALADGSVV